MTAESTTLIIWAVTASYLALGVVLVLCTTIIQRALKDHGQFINPALEQLAHMKRTLDYLEAGERVRRQDIDDS